MSHIFKYLLHLLTVLLLVCVPLQSQAGELTISGPETPSLVISGNTINRGQGFLHNYVAVSSSDMDGIVDSASGEATYRLGLGDCFTEAVTYSTFEDHGTPTWIFRRVYGLDLGIMAEALGIDTKQMMSVSVYAEDGMSRTLSDAFGTKSSRWTYDGTGTKGSTVSPVLALFETTSETEEPGTGVVMPDLPQLGQNSPDRVDNVFGYGQIDFREITSCYWVKNVRRLRFGTETSALTIHDAGGSTIDVSLSTLITRGMWQAGIGTIKAQGIPVRRLLSDSGIDLPAGHYLKVQGRGSSVDLTPDQLEDAFVAWHATDNGSSVKNATPLRLYYGRGEALADLISLSVVSGGGVDAPSVIDSGFTDLGGYGWAREAIADLLQRGVVRGMSSDSYGPGLELRRGDFILMLARAYDLTAVTDGNFRDVPAGSYYYDAIAAARSLGIARGDGEFFRPGSSITRQEAFTLIYRTLFQKGVKLTSGSSALSVFRDAGLVADWAIESVGSLVTAGLVRGSDNAVNPDGMLTRAEMAVIMSRALELN